MIVLRAAVLRFLVLYVAWWAISEGDLSMAGYGVFAALSATAASLALLQPRPSPPLLRRLPALARLIGWFVRQSVLGGVDVAKRVLRPTVDVDPEIITVPIETRSILGRVTIADISCLTPGSLSVDLSEDGLLLHVLHRELPIRAQIAELDEMIARVLPDDPETKVES